LLGKLREAEVNLGRSLKIRREKLGDKEEKTITTMGNLSVVYIDLAKHKEAEDLLQACHQYMQSGSKGAPTPNKLLSSFGRLYLTAERYSDAEWCFLNAIEIGRRKKEDNSELGWSYRFLAEVYLARGEAAQAKTALDISVNLHPFLKNQQVGRHYAHVYLLEGKLELADKSLADHLQKLKSAKNPDALEQAKDLELLARVKVERKQLAEATALYQECLKLRESVLGGDHPLVAAVLEQQCRYLPQPPAGAAARARAIRKQAEARKPLGLARRQAAGQLLFEGTTEVPKD
jgi:tetratricopeptide (TPR) repeat protein